MIVCIGQSLVDCIVRGEGEKAESIVLAPGGEALNEAFTLAALRAEVSLSSGIGTDFAGNLLRNLARDAGIRLIEGYRGLTPVAVLKVDEYGGRKSTISRIHDMGGYLPKLPEGDMEAVLMGSLFRPPFLDPEHAFLTAKKAKEKGAVLLADTKMPRGADPRLSDYQKTLELLDFITPNEQEALHYTGQTAVCDAAKVLHASGVRTVIVKLAERGVFVSGDEECFRLPAFRADTSDGVGAGDSFAAGFIYGVLHGRTLYDAALFGEACAAVTVTGTGGIGAWQTLKSLMDEGEESVLGRYRLSDA